jgi:hypothetical protein
MTGLGPHRYPGDGEGIQVAIDGSKADPELPSQVRRRRPAVQLQSQQKPKQTIRTHISS